MLDASTLVGGVCAVLQDKKRVANIGLAHLGVMTLTCFMAGPLLRNGTLVRVLEDWEAEVLPVYVVYPPNRHLSSKLRVFVDWMVELLSRESMGGVKMRCAAE